MTSCTRIILKNPLAVCQEFRTEQMRPGSRWAAYIHSSDKRRQAELHEEASKLMSEPKTVVAPTMGYATALPQPSAFGMTNNGGNPATQIIAPTMPALSSGNLVNSIQPTRFILHPAGQASLPTSTLVQAPQAGSNPANPIILSHPPTDPVMQLLQTSINTFDLTRPVEVRSLLGIVASSVGHGGSNSATVFAGNDLSGDSRTPYVDGEDLASPPTAPTVGIGGDVHGTQVEDGSCELLQELGIDPQLFEYSPQMQQGSAIDRAVRAVTDSDTDKTFDALTSPMPRRNKHAPNAGDTFDALKKLRRSGTALPLAARPIGSFNYAAMAEPEEREISMEDFLNGL
ncbi:hypothetical protein LTR36_005846 [Oleoguttula mirabilis]|uniref:Uncharacterized protein n=1 Tax=Oleoguttula mirabilis TaxID=1507867 RepID=A0AAV9JDK3_9PEZI|nr:hypothetical protein LTR36_005846 [Oleoguttula mirabilis]